MREFFGDWKRKAGCVTLVFACAFAMGWIRSETIFDQIRWNGEISDLVGSAGGTFSISIGLPLKIDLKYLDWSAEAIPEISSWEVGDFGYDQFSIAGGVQRSLFVPYWSIVIPLTLLSAYLLISQPHPKRNQTDDTKTPPKTFDTL